MNAYYALVIFGTLVGFCGLAYLLLAPIWRFLDREKEVSEEWTKKALARRHREQGNGHNEQGNGYDAKTPPRRPGGNGAPPPPPRGAPGRASGEGRGARDDPDREPPPQQPE